MNANETRSVRTLPPTSGREKQPSGRPESGSVGDILQTPVRKGAG